MRDTEDGRTYGRRDIGSGRRDPSTRDARSGRLSSSDSRLVGETLPRVFVNVACKGVTNTVSLLFATFARGCVSVADKELRSEEVRESARPLEARGKRADSGRVAGERRTPGLKDGLRKTARSKRARI